MTTKFAVAVAVAAVAAALAFAPVVARAEIVPVPADDPTPTPPDAEPPVPPPPPIVHAPLRWRFEGILGVRFGTFTVDGADTGTDVTGALILGARRDRLFVYGEYDLTSLTYPLAAASPIAITTPDLDGVGNGVGLMHRFGGNVRWLLMGGHEGEDDHDRLAGGLYVEGGVGVERYDWDAGGVWWRPDLALGVGTELLGYGADHHGGMTLGLRVTLARRGDLDGAPAVCGGPCSYPTGPTGIDRSFMFELGVALGR